jgi:hypothetical protein
MKRLININTILIVVALVLLLNLSIVCDAIGYIIYLCGGTK